VSVSAPESLTAELELLVAKEQHEKRLPSIAAAVLRDGELVWETAVGADATPDTQYRLGSITKTFTAAAIMQLRDAGELDLEDTLDRHIEGAAHAPTIRRLLSHTSGLQRETHDDAWLRQRFATVDELLETLHEAEHVLPPGARFHYSNLAFALLGQVVARLSGTGYTDYVDEHIIGPLGLQRTTWRPTGTQAQGYLVDEYARTVWKEPETDLAGAAAAGQLWSTVEDLARWAWFLAAGDEAVLAPRIIEEMWFPQVMYDPADWSLAWGLGLMLYNSEGAIYGGHGGAMAGHLAGVYVNRKTQIGGAALTNSGTRGNMDLFAISLAKQGAEIWPRAIDAWRPEEEPPADVRPLLGRWWSEGNEFLFWWEGGELRARVAAAPPGKGETSFTREDGGWRASGGRERGERLRVEGERLVWAGYPFTRVQEPFKA
jgi:CubicO group peptidase (beta-lactamase class C family)